MSEKRRDITHNIVFLVKDDEVLLAMKKRGFGEGLWNGTGGKPTQGETIEQAAIRETQEEIGVEIGEEALKHAATIRFYGGGVDYVGTQVYIANDWEGEPIETEEMRPKWFNKNQIPYDQMWDDDKFWYPAIFAGFKIEAEFNFDDDDRVEGYRIETIGRIT